MTFVYIDDLSNQTELTLGFTDGLQTMEDDANKTVYTNVIVDLPITYHVFMVVLGIMIVVLNLIVVATSGLVVKKRLEPRCTYLLLGNLAITDMLIGVLAVLGTTYLKYLKYRTPLACSIQIGIYVSAMIVSMYSVTLIAVDRFLYIIHGIKYNQLVYPKRVRLMITLTWIFGFTIGLLPAFGWTNEWRYGNLCRFTTLLPSNLMIITGTVATVPIPVILITYAVILMKALRTIRKIATSNSVQIAIDEVESDQSKKQKTGLRMFRGNQQINKVSQPISNSKNSGQPSSNSMDMLTNSKTSIPIETETYKANEKKWKAIKVVMFTTGAYMISWMPIIIDFILLGICDRDKTPDKCMKIRNLTRYFSILAFMNCFLNPIIYAWWHNGFRKAAKKIYSRKKTDFIKWCQRHDIK